MVLYGFVPFSSVLSSLAGLNKRIRGSRRWRSTSAHSCPPWRAPGPPVEKEPPTTCQIACVFTVRRLSHMGAVGAPGGVPISNSVALIRSALDLLHSTHMRPCWGPSSLQLSRQLLCPRSVMNPPCLRSLHLFGLASSSQYVGRSQGRGFQAAVGTSRRCWTSSPATCTRQPPRHSCVIRDSNSGHQFEFGTPAALTTR